MGLVIKVKVGCQRKQMNPSVLLEKHLFRAIRRMRFEEHGGSKRLGTPRSPHVMVEATVVRPRRLGNANWKRQYLTHAEECKAGWWYLAIGSLREDGCLTEEG